MRESNHYIISIPVGKDAPIAVEWLGKAGAKKSLGLENR